MTSQLRQFYAPSAKSQTQMTYETTRCLLVEYECSQRTDIHDDSPHEYDEYSRLIWRNIWLNVKLMSKHSMSIKHMSVRVCTLMSSTALFPATVDANSRNKK